MYLQNMRKIDLSTLTRDELRDWLSTAKDERKRYNNCKEDLESCERSIAEAQKFLKGDTKFTYVFAYGTMIMGIIGGVIGIGYTYSKDMLTTPILLACLCFVGLGLNSLYAIFFKANRIRKDTQNKIDNYQTQLPELQKRYKDSERGLNKLWSIPDEYCYDYAFTKMLQYIDSFKAHNWKEVTTLYDRHIQEQPVENNTRITAEEKKGNNGPSTGETLGCLAVILSLLTLGLFNAVNKAGKDFGKS